MTTYYLSIGYLSGYSSDCSREEAWEQLKTLATALPADIPAIVAEAIRLGAPDTPEDPLLDFAQVYCQVDHAIHLDESNEAVRFSASGYRPLKEHLCRAMCRLLIERMHRQGIEVDLGVH